MRPLTTSLPTSNQAATDEPGQHELAGLARLQDHAAESEPVVPAEPPEPVVRTEPVELVIPTSTEPIEPVELVRVRLDLAYDGTGFHGWAAQPGLRTVQQVLAEALGRALALPEPPTLTVAGRTDAGVHARGQVAHADVPAEAWAKAADSASRRVTRLLPDDLRLWRIAVAPPGFDARFSALYRRYSYRVCDDPARADPLRRHDTLWYRRQVDLGRMNEAALACLGEHDFAAFCRRRDGATTIREVLRLDWARAEPGIAIATVTADAFCHNMVRALTGALLSVGDGSRPAQWLAEVLAARRRDPAVRVAPPHPLCLEEVGYPDAAGLAARAALTRRTRQLTDQRETGRPHHAVARRSAADTSCCG